MAWHDLVSQTGVCDIRNFSGFDFKNPGWMALITSVCGCQVLKTTCAVAAGEGEALAAALAGPRPEPLHRARRRGVRCFAVCCTRVQLCSCARCAARVCSCARTGCVCSCARTQQRPGLVLTVIEFVREAEEAAERAALRAARGEQRAGGEGAAAGRQPVRSIGHPHAAATATPAGRG